MIWEIMCVQTFIVIKNPKPFEPDYVFEVPEAIRNNGFVSTNLKYAKDWYVQIYPKKETTDEADKS